MRLLLWVAPALRLQKDGQINRLSDNTFLSGAATRSYGRLRGGLTGRCDRYVATRCNQS
jgi:hypothetical protein